MKTLFTSRLGAFAVLFLLILSASASPSSALREYNSGQFDVALKDYQKLLERKTNDWRLHFNAGAAAYRGKKYDEACKQFTDALLSQDVKLQQRAYYNRGNSLFRLGEANQDQQKKTETWEKSVKDFESSVKLDAQDQDAKANLEYVKKKLEELKQQQQNQQNQQPPPQPSEAAKKAKAEADKAVLRREYAKALDIMEKQLAQDSTTSAYNDYIQRLKEVTGVQQQNAPHAPAK
jgi:tetratricopeptide (TPR) repeat protein